MFSGGDIAAGLDTIATRASNQLTGKVIQRLGRVGPGAVTTDWPSQQIVNIPARKQVDHWISARPKRGRERERERIILHE